MDLGVTEPKMDKASSSSLMGHTILGISLMVRRKEKELYSLKMGPNLKVIGKKMYLLEKG